MLQEGFITFFEIIKAILMGIVEGITEWLPISSTGHMILVEQVVKFNASEEFMSMFRGKSFQSRDCGASPKP